MELLADLAKMDLHEMGAQIRKTLRPREVILRVYQAKIGQEVRLLQTELLHKLERDGLHCRQSRSPASNGCAGQQLASIGGE